MSIFRILPERSNTIASGIYSSYNSGQNHITELWYGGGGTDTSPEKRNSYSRFLIYFDLTDFQAKLSTKDINQSGITSFKLKIKNSIPRDKVLEREYEFDKLDKAVSSSYDLICFPINRNWDEGRGYDMYRENYLIKQAGNPLITGYSNWYSATTTTGWNGPGVFTNPTASTVLYSSQHIDIGDEDIDMDITRIVNDWLSGGSTNYGLGIAYRRDFELLSTTTRYIASFYTEKTNTAFKPYIEVNYNQYIKDDRIYVTNNRVSRLYLYTFSGNNIQSYYSASTVNILDSSSNVVHSGLTPIQLSRGVYYIDVYMSGATKGQKYRDVWRGVTFNPGYDSQDITQNFIIKDNYFTSQRPKINEYALTPYGLSNNQILSSGEIYRIYCDLRVNYSSREEPTTQFAIQYKLVMNKQEDVIPWTNINQACIDGCQNYFFDLNTEWLLHNQTYELKFRIMELGTIRLMDESITFRILNSLDF